MKKKFKIIIPIIVILIITIFIVVLALTNNNKTSFYSVKKHYSILSDQYSELELTIYSNKNDNDYLNISKIKKCSLYNEIDYYDVTLSSIELLNNKKIIDDIEYYQYRLKIKLNFEIEKMLLINDAKLEVYYNTNEKMLINVGNICFDKQLKESYLSVDKVQGICNDLGNLESLVAVKLSVSNNFDKIIKIKSIKPISSSIKINNDYVLIKEHNTIIEHKVHTSQLFGSNYNLYVESKSSFKPIELNENTAKDLIIPLTYNEKEFVDHMGFVLELEIEGNIYYQIINPYILFNSSNVSYAFYEYEIVQD